MVIVNGFNFIKKIKEPLLSPVADAIRNDIVNNFRCQMAAFATTEFHTSAAYFSETLKDECRCRVSRMGEDGCETYLLALGISQNELDEAKETNVQIAYRKLYHELSYICDLIKEEHLNGK